MSSVGIDRRRWWNIFRIEEDLQKRQVIQVLGCLSIHVALSTVIVCVFFVYFSDPRPESADRSFWETLGVIASTWGERTDLQRLAMAWIVSMSGLGTIFAAAMGSYFSQKVAGPVYRLKKDLDRIAATGSFRNVTLRDGDEFGDLVEAVNQALAVARRGAAAAEPADTGQIVDELWKHLASFQQEGLCEPDAQRVEAWLEGIGRLLNDAGHGARSTA